MYVNSSKTAVSVSVLVSVSVVVPLLFGTDAKIRKISFFPNNMRTFFGEKHNLP
jgi:hypothetical protein